MKWRDSACCVDFRRKEELKKKKKKKKRGRRVGDPLTTLKRILTTSYQPSIVVGVNDNW